MFNLSTSIRVLPRVTSFETTWKLARFPPPCSHAFRILASLREKDRHEDAILEIVGYFQGNIFAETRGKGLVIRETNDAILETWMVIFEEYLFIERAEGFIERVKGEYTCWNINFLRRGTLEKIWNGYWNRLGSIILLPKILIYILWYKLVINLFMEVEKREEEKLSG